MEGNEREFYVSRFELDWFSRVAGALIQHRRPLRLMGLAVVTVLIIAIAFSVAFLLVGFDRPVFTWFSVNLISQHLTIYFLMGYWVLPRLLYKGRLGWLTCWIVAGWVLIYFTNRALIFTVEPTLPQAVRYVDRIRGLMKPGDLLSLRVFLWNFVFSVFSPAVFITLKVIKDTTLYRHQQFQLKRSRLLLDRDNAALKLSFVKAQISPHFLFNTLNSIYSQVIGTDEQAADLVLKLAELMRYNLNETSEPLVSLEQEVDYLRSYVVLEQVRHGERLSVRVDIGENLTNYQIAPLLLGTYVENAFKHGVKSGSDKSYVVVKAVMEADWLLFMVENSVSQGPTIVVTRKSGGVGLPNVSKRLTLLYPDRHRVVQDITDHYYRVTLRIRLVATGTVTKLSATLTDSR